MRCSVLARLRRVGNPADELLCGEVASFARMMTREAASSFRRSLSGRKGTPCARKCAPSPVAALTASNAGRAIVVATLLTVLNAPSAACETAFPMSPRSNPVSIVAGC